MFIAADSVVFLDALSPSSGVLECTFGRILDLFVQSCSLCLAFCCSTLSVSFSYFGCLLWFAVSRIVLFSCFRLIRLALSGPTAFGLCFFVVVCIVTIFLVFFVVLFSVGGISFVGL